MSELIQDVRYGFRALGCTPGFTAIAVAVLALGIGANATVFSLANAFFLRPLPVSDPDTFVRVYSNRFSNTRYPTYAELRARNSILAELAGFQLRSFGLRVDADNEHTFGEIVTGNYFPTIGASAASGRLLVESDDVAGAPPVVVLSHAFWMRRFGGAPDAVGRTIALNGQPFTIVGIAPQGFTGILTPLAGSLWVPLASDALLRPGPDLAARMARDSFHLAGRLKPGVDRARAQVDLDTIGRQIRAAEGQPDRGTPAVTVYGATMLHPEMSLAVTVFTGILLAVVALVLMIVCVNVANLVLARAAGRDREIAVRQSLGAGRGRLIRQLLTENLILSLGGAAAGLGLAYWCIRFVMAMPLPVPVPVTLDLSLDMRVVAYTAGIAILATLGFGLAPALTASRVDLVRALKGAGADTPRHGRLRSAFLIGQVAMSVLLLVVAGLAIRSVRSAQAIDTGFDSTGVIAGSVDLETRGYSPERAAQFLRSLIERLESTPGVVAANAVDIVPLTLSNQTTRKLRDGDPRPAAGEAPVTPMIYTNAVGPGHFKTLKIPLVRGRDFTYLDTEAAPNVAIVNETMAERFWPGKDAVGQRLIPLDAGAAPAETLVVIGVVRDSKYVTIGEDPRSFMYQPLVQAYTPRVTLLVRGTGTPADAIGTVKREMQALDGGLALFAVSSLDEAISISLVPARIAGALLGTLGLFALVLAALGVYGVLSFLVRSRTREIGVRVAIGATPRAVVAMVVRQAMVWTVTGMAIGLALAAVAARLLGSVLYGISPTDPVTFGAVILLLGGVAGLAAVIPALRASRLDPLVALRTL
jgi:predicted permease